MENPFKYGTLVNDPYFTDRVKEQQYIKQFVESSNHLILISPRRFGKSSLVKKAIDETHRPCITINMQQVTSVEDLASLLLKGVFRLHQWERIKHYLSLFRIVPTVTTSPLNNDMEFSFQPSVSSSHIILEDTMALLERVSSPQNRIIIIFDEFQEILEIERGLDKRLRAIMQGQQNLNYIFLGSQESMMTDIFEKVKSPFYHFGMLMHLDKIPYTDFYNFLTDRLNPVAAGQSSEIAEEILSFTQCHPYYTQQLAARVWELLVIDDSENVEHVTERAIRKLVEAHDLDFERIWTTFNRTDRKALQLLSVDSSAPSADRTMPASTMYSALKRLLQNGYVTRTDSYAIEDPFFRFWIRQASL